jgi:hypothetical protein
MRLKQPTALIQVALLCVAVTAGAQDSTHLRAVKAQADSLRKETCRGGTLSASGLTCRGATAGPRVTVIRRLANRVDSIEATVPVPVTPVPDSVTPAPHIGYAATVYYNSLAFGFPDAGVDTVTVCAVLEDQAGVRKLAWPPVRIKTLGDSAAWAPRGGNPLAQMCAKAMAVSGLAVADSIPVTWSADWATIGPSRLWRPFPAVPE